MMPEVAEVPSLLAIEENLRVRRGLGQQVAAVLAVIVLGAMILIPLLEAIGRPFPSIRVVGGSGWVQHLVFWLALLGGILATLNGRHLSIAIISRFTARGAHKGVAILAGSAAMAVLLCLALAALALVGFQYQSPEMVAGWLPVWIAMTPLPVCLVLMALSTMTSTSNRWQDRALMGLLATLATVIVLYAPDGVRDPVTGSGLVLILLLAAVGMPLYAVLGGASVLLFSASDVTVIAIPAETYRILTQPVLPSIPLFALTGTVLAAGGAPRRLIRFIRAWTGSLPGGAAIASVIGCAFFTAITGASGVTILALGGLLLPLLLAANLQKGFSTGLLTASGSVGLLFPPSLPVILYGVYGHVAIDRLFLAALLPGLLLVAMLSGFSVFRGRKHLKKRSAFDLHEALNATWQAKGDLLLPVVVLIGLFTGILTLVETAALTALWAILLEGVFHRELDLRSGLTNAITDSAVLMGALLMILGVGAGVISYLIDAEIPQRATEWVMNTISSKIVFLLALNVLLLVVGALMDIFSAIVIVVPLIVPMGQAFGVDPVHLGVIFLANLELGYLTPPIGMNLFLSSLRFKQPLLEVWRTVAPFLIIFVVWVFLIVYVPALTVGVANVLDH